MIIDEPHPLDGTDRLGTAEFVRRIIPPIVEWPSRSGLVVGLYAPWGYGKSTVLNWLGRALEKRSRDGVKPWATVVRFNPWLYASPEALVASFFGTLAQTVSHSQGLSPHSRKQLAKALKAIGAFASVPAVAAAHASIGSIAAVAGATSRLLEHRGEVALEQSKEAAVRVLTENREQIPQHRIVVLIDDLDRASSNEVRAMLKLVKLIADLPNVTYVIAMDERRVREILESDPNSEYGGAFLEKVIQVPISLPRIPRSTLRELTEISLREVIEPIYPGREIFSRYAWSESGIPWERTLGLRMHTLRDRARLVNDVRFAIHTKPENLDVDPLDVVMLSFLHVFYPRVYEIIRRNKDFFTATLSHNEMTARIVDGKVAERRKSRLATLLGLPAPEPPVSAELLAEPSDWVIVHAAIKYLFPTVDSGKTTDGAQLRLTNRIQRPERFDRYFHLATPNEASDATAEVLISELRSISQGKASASPFASTRGLSDEQRGSLVRKVYDRLSSLLHAEAVDERSILNLTEVLLDGRRVGLTEEESRGLAGRVAQIVAMWDRTQGELSDTPGKILLRISEELDDVGPMFDFVYQEAFVPGKQTVSSQMQVRLARSLSNRMDSYLTDLVGDTETHNTVPERWMRILHILEEAGEPGSRFRRFRRMFEHHAARSLQLLPDFLRRIAFGNDPTGTLPDSASLYRIIGKWHDVERFKQRLVTIEATLSAIDPDDAELVRKAIASLRAYSAGPEEVT
jgi:hypothetical protein